jgi:hypothetical protein
MGMISLIPTTPPETKKQQVVPLIILFALLIAGVVALYFLYGRSKLESIVAPIPVESQPQVGASSSAVETQTAVASPEEEDVPLGTPTAYDAGLFGFSYPDTLTVSTGNADMLVLKPKMSDAFYVFIRQTERPLESYEAFAATSYPGVKQVVLTKTASADVRLSRGNVIEWVYTNQYASYSITMDPSGSTRGLMKHEQEIIDLILSTLKEKKPALVEKYFWRGLTSIPVTFYYPRALYVTSTPRGVLLSTEPALLEEACAEGDVAECVTGEYAFLISSTTVTSTNDLNDPCREAVPSKFPRVLEMVVRADAPAECTKQQRGFVNSWVFQGTNVLYMIAVDRLAETSKIPFDYVLNQLLSTLKER